MSSFNLIQAVAFFFFSLSLAPFASAAAQGDYLNYAVDAANVLNAQWYNSSNGLWENMWWNSANMVTTLADFSIAYSGAKSHSLSIAGSAGTFTKAKVYNDQSYLNNFYDDEGWWALAWIRMYDVSGDAQFLETAEFIFADLLTGNSATCGGHWWSKDKSSNSLIADSLYLATAAALANRIPDKKSYYQGYAQAQVDWFLSSAPFTANNTLMDGFDVVNGCKPEGSVFTYNQGAAIGALVEVYKLTNNAAYIDEATKIAKGTLATMVDGNGILTEFNNAFVATDGAQFKGVFMRNLVALHHVKPDAAYVTFIQTNADSVWKHARDGYGKMGYAWQGPWDAGSGSSAASHSSALDCLIAAVAVS
nr:hypothetical protein CFP56_43802 [Quercus suber]